MFLRLLYVIYIRLYVAISVVVYERARSLLQHCGACINRKIANCTCTIKYHTLPVPIGAIVSSENSSDFGRRKAALKFRRDVVGTTIRSSAARK